MDIAIVHLVVIEGVLGLAILFEILDVVSVLHVALAAE